MKKIKINSTFVKIFILSFFIMIAKKSTDHTSVEHEKTNHGILLENVLNRIANHFLYEAENE
jgi:hypothetical protein